jgi:benzoate/toluate 1,2-dioxygenase beta subunit
LSRRNRSTEAGTRHTPLSAATRPVRLELYAEDAETSLPEPRTSHNISNVEILAQSDTSCELRFNWVTFSFRYKTSDTYFGTSFYTLDPSGKTPLIARKKVVLKNDYIHHVIDIYHI